MNLLLNGSVVAARTIARPATGQTSASTTLTGLAYGTYEVQVGAFPGTDGSGVSQAGGAGTMTVTEDVPGSLSVAMGSTVASLSISPANPVVATNGTTTLTASATDASGAIVPLAAGGGAEALVWTSGDAAATVTGTGPTAILAGGAGVGTAHVTASLVVDDAGTLKTASASVRVIAPTMLPIAPSDARTISHGLHPPDVLADGLRDGNYVLAGAGTYTARWQALFPLSGIPVGATIVSATITASTTDHLNDGGFHSIFAYPSVAGTLSTALPSGQTSLGMVPNTGPVSIDATAAVRAYVAAGTPYAGMLVSANVGYFVSWTAPTLTVAYIVP